MSRKSIDRVQMLPVTLCAIALTALGLLLPTAPLLVSCAETQKILRDTRAGYDAAVTALEEVDAAAGHYVDSIARPTADDIANAEQLSALLQSAHASIQQARADVLAGDLGDAEVQLMSAYLDLEAVASDLNAHGALPPQARQALDALKRLLPAPSS